MSLVLISKECICVCLCKLGICTILISNMILLWFMSALIYVVCCYGYMYSLDSLPISFYQPAAREARGRLDLRLLCGFPRLLVYIFVRPHSRAQ